MSEAHELIQGLNRLSQELRETREEVKRLREEFAKLSANAPTKKDRVETTLEGLLPVVADVLRGKRRGR